MKWLREIFEKDSNISSKRALGVLLILWSIGAATYFIVCIKSQTPSSLSAIQFFCTTGAGLLAAGIVEKFKKNEGNKE
jgi:hypothetical protein